MSDDDFNRNIVGPIEVIAAFGVDTASDEGG